MFPSHDREAYYGRGRKENYPFDAMECGQSFVIVFGEVNESTLRNIVSTQNAGGEKKFIVVKHSDLKLYEVARAR